MEVDRSDQGFTGGASIPAEDGRELLFEPDKTTIVTSGRKHFGWWQIPIWGVVLGLLGVLGWGLYQQTLAQPKSGQPQDFTLSLYGGGQFHLADQRGKVVVVNFWASWCQPCEQEASDLEQTWRKYQDRGVTFVGVDYVDTQPEALAYLKRLNITYQNGPDAGTRISQGYRIRGVPETFVIGPTGQIAFFKEGPTTVAELSGQIDPLLASVSK